MAPFCANSLLVGGPPASFWFKLVRQRSEYHRQALDQGREQCVRLLSVGLIVSMTCCKL